ncbi:motility associated factor glycosyltransferase family protein [Paenibacillus rhizovicinus]|uniref:Motility associated factor glycosyltransferase family protein n=1 Tax=Paenibacillus rhizovicinus TaxID=2704463 RepID=A0A6C0P279_9BACL|nr:6-hydroxymethylpterin diphosphokinase MptE-like protein [Paenibacillus rhizovicinus]QHW32604.1 motility associated factor glycosyltransferase family protein [Paenibacillus rhizovicinus]
MNNMYQVDAVVEQIKDFLPTLITACGSVSLLLYRPMTDQSWEQFGSVVEGIDDLYRTLNVLYNDMSQSGCLSCLVYEIDQMRSELGRTFQVMNQHMDNEDYVSASGCIEYELIPLLQRHVTNLGEPQYVMDERFVRNLAYLKENFPNAYEQLGALTRDTDNYQITYAQNGFPNVYIGGEVSTYLYSQYDPEHEARRWTEWVMTNGERTPNIIMFGFGLGYHVRTYAEANPEHNIYVYEPDEQVLLTAMMVIDFTALFMNVKVKEIIVGRTKGNRDKFLYQFLRYLKGGADTLSLPVYDRIKKEEKIEFFNEARISIINYDSAYLMYERYGLQWVTNYMYNFAKTMNSPSVIDLRGKFEGIPVVIVGAGPSLEADIECLRELKKHALIIAAGTTTQSLLHYGVEPHLIVCIDGTEDNYNAFKDLNFEHIPFLFSPMVHHQILEKPIKNLVTFVYNSDITIKYLLELDENYPYFRPTDSVTGAAIQAAIYMGSHEIIFTGQDLSYPGANIYAPGANHFSQQYSDDVISKATHFVENIRGTTNRTNANMQITLASIQDLLAQYPQTRFTNATQMGAKIKHTVWEPLTEVLGRYKDKVVDPDVFKKVIEKLPRHDERQVTHFTAKIVQLREELTENERKLRMLEQSLSKLSELSRVNVNKFHSEMDKLSIDWRSVVHSNAFRALYIKLYRNEIVDMERELSDVVQEFDAVKRAEKTYEVMIPLIKTILQGTPTLLEIVDESIRRI